MPSAGASPACVTVQLVLGAAPWIFTVTPASKTPCPRLLVGEAGIEGGFFGSPEETGFDVANEMRS
jgi:hypothetical protein